MKKTLLIIVFITAGLNSFACDICGCGGGNFYMGLLPHFKSKFIGLRYHYMNYNTRLAADSSQFSRNFYNTIEVWGGLNAGRHWQLLGFIPYHLNKQIDDDGISHRNGVGDITLLANYQVLHKMTRGNRRGTEQQLWIGGGVKLPTGTFGVNVKDPNLTVRDVNAQLGTGSIDFLFNAIYNVRVGNCGVNTIASYKLNMAKDAYRFGDKLTVNSIAFYSFPVGKEINLLPNIGAMYEYTAGDVLHRQPVDATGGYIATASAGVEMNLQRFTVGLNAQAPFSQHYADGQTRLNWRGNLHVSVTL